MIVAAVAMSASLAACGSDEDDSDEPESASSSAVKAQLVGLWKGNEGESGVWLYHRFNSDGTGFYCALNSSGKNGKNFVDYRVVKNSNTGNYDLLIMWEGEDEWDNECQIYLKSGKLYMDWDGWEVFEKQ